jgi:hypothetical protein
MFAPNPIQVGSSISHWDVTATPNLLMEPALNASLSQDPDLTVQLFKDIGWFTGFVAVGGPRTGDASLRNAPNPFAAATTMRFTLPGQDDVALDVYDLGGRRVRRVFEGPLGAGEHAFRWDGSDDQGRPARSGVYLYRLRGREVGQSRHLILVR